MKPRAPLWIFPASTRVCLFLRKHGVCKWRRTHVKMDVVTNISEKHKCILTTCTQLMRFNTSNIKNNQMFLMHQQQKHWCLFLPSFSQCIRHEKQSHERPDACCSNCFRTMSLHSFHSHTIDAFQCIKHQKQPSIPPATAETVLVFALIFATQHA